ncbi:VOC family protein [Pseudooceanicola sp.]|uniref:VOC family protein n=1 Tax=Pseudooceanicola sp. TaxID=1914328 RepID=UPI00405A20DF
MPTLPYLHFQNGQCEEALTFYKEVFGGTDLHLMRYAEAPDVPDDWKSGPHVIHGEITLGDGKLMASDFPPGFEGDPQKAVSVMQSAPDVETAHRWFDALLAEGDVIQEMTANFFSPAFGMVRDRYGTHWMIAALPPEGPDA